MKSMPDSENTIWGAQTLEALNSVLIMTSADGTSKTDLTDAYVTDKPELNIWLKDSDGKATSYFSSSAIFRIGILTSQIIWEKSLMDITPEVNDDGETEYKIKKSSKYSAKKIGTYIMAGICCVCIIAAVAFALIQYVMCILEFTIVQGIGAGFIPFYLFDGTKDIPKKLVPVFLILSYICNKHVSELCRRPDFSNKWKHGMACFWRMYLYMFDFFCSNKQCSKNRHDTFNRTAAT